VGWGAGEDEEAGAILKVSLRPWGFFISSTLKQSFCAVLASLTACAIRTTVRLGHSLAAALLGTRRVSARRGQVSENDNLFERAVRSDWVIGLFVCLLWLDVSAVFAHDSEVSTMKRRQQGILTGMPFMAHVSSRSFVDDAGRKIYLAKTPTRVVSLAPSVTEMLFAIGAGDQVVGVTQFCNYPPEALKKPKVGYANPNLESLVALQPDLVVAPNEFLKPDDVSKLDQLKIPVFVLLDKNIEDIFVHIQTLGRMLNRSTAANAVSMELRQQVAQIKQRTERFPPVRVLYVLNSEPLITVGPGSFIDQLIVLAGGVNVAGKSGIAYPRLSMEAVLQDDPEVLVFPVGESEGISDSEQQAWHRWSTMTAVKQGRLHQIPADLLNRPGPRIARGLELLANILHPNRTSSGHMNQ
jgi:iron complex transport system substrate-binding protein